MALNSSHSIYLFQEGSLVHFSVQLPKVIVHNLSIHPFSYTHYTMHIIFYATTVQSRFQMVVKSNTVSLRHKHSPETLFIHINQCICIVLALSGIARQSIFHLNYCFQKNFILEIFIFENFIFRKICLILFDFYLILFNLIICFFRKFILQ